MTVLRFKLPVEYCSLYQLEHLSLLSFQVGSHLYITLVSFFLEQNIKLIFP